MNAAEEQQEDMVATLDEQCPATSTDGLPCQKRNHWAVKYQEWWEHPGGHVFGSDSVMRKLQEEHVDATALLSGLPAVSHPYSQCRPDGLCFAV